MAAFLLFYLMILFQTARSKPPNIIVIVADDLGFNDVSWHNPDILTPNLHKLAKSGIILEQSYVQPLCTPTRAALLTGYYPIRTGLQHGVFKPQEPRGLKVNFTLLPEHLTGLGYSTHMVGKWHLGFCNKKYLPTRRGFDTFFGFFNGAGDYFNHTRRSVKGKKIDGYDFRNNDEMAFSERGKYSAHVFAEQAVDVISRQNKSSPFFLYLAFQSVHSPLQVPETYEEPFRHFNNSARRTFSGMVMAMDEAVGNVTRALQEAGLDNDTIIVFTTDNGGATRSGGNNYPLRGNKKTLWEGGTRGAAFIVAPQLKNPGTVSNQLFHVTDWLPTLMEAAGGETDRLSSLDGKSQWLHLTKGDPSPRNEFLYNLDPVDENGAIRVGKYKLIIGDPGKPSGWIPPPEVLGVDETDLDEGNFSMPNKFNCNNIFEKKGVLLFDLEADPEERTNIAADHPDIVLELQNKLTEYRLVMVPPDIAESVKRGNPVNWNGNWSPGWCRVGAKRDFS